MYECKRIHTRTLERKASEMKRRKKNQEKTSEEGKPSV